MSRRTRFWRFRLHLSRRGLCDHFLVSLLFLVFSFPFQCSRVPHAPYARSRPIGLVLGLKENGVYFLLGWDYGGTNIMGGKGSGFNKGLCIIDAMRCT